MFIVRTNRVKSVFSECICPKFLLALGHNRVYWIHIALSKRAGTKKRSQVESCSVKSKLKSLPTYLMHLFFFSLNTYLISIGMSWLFMPDPWLIFLIQIKTEIIFQKLYKFLTGLKTLHYLSPQQKFVLI